MANLYFGIGELPRTQALPDILAAARWANQRAAAVQREEVKYQVAVKRANELLGKHLLPVQFEQWGREKRFSLRGQSGRLYGYDGRKHSYSVIRRETMTAYCAVPRYEMPYPDVALVTFLVLTGAESYFLSKAFTTPYMPGPDFPSDYKGLI